MVLETNLPPIEKLAGYAVWKIDEAGGARLEERSRF
jgi:hypothetical protein